MDYRTIGLAPLAFVLLLVHSEAAEQPSVAGELAAVERYPWHPDGLVAVMGDERGRKWDLAGRGLDVRPDGKQLAAGDDGAIYLWNAETLQLERLLHGHEGPVLSVRYSPNGSLLTSCGMDKTVRVWDLAADGPAKGAIVGTLYALYPATWSADGNTLVFGGSGNQPLQIWRGGARDGWPDRTAIHTDDPASVETPEYVEELAKALDAKGMMSFSSFAHAVSADSAMLAIASGGKSISIETDGGVVQTSESSTVVLWQIDGAKPVKLWTIEGVGFVTRMAFSPEGHLLAIGTNDHVVRTFSIGNGPPAIRHKMTMPEPVLGFCFHPHGETLVVADRTTARLWKLVPEAATPGLAGPITQPIPMQMAFSPDGRTLFYVDGPKVRRWDIAGPYVEPAGAANFFLTGVHSLIFTPDDGQLLAGVATDASNKVACWSFDAPTATLIWEIDLEEKHADDLTLTPDGSRFVFSAYNHPQYTLELWERTKDGPRKLDVADLEDGHAGSFWCATFSPDGMTLATGHRDGAIRIWDTSGDRLIFLQTFTHVHQGGVGGLAFSPDGNALASVDWGGGVHLWRVVEGFPNKPRAGQHGSRAYTVSFSPDGKVLATGDYGGEIFLWDVEAERPQPAKLTAHTAGVASFDFSADGRRLLSAGQDGRVIIWDVVERKVLKEWRFPGHVVDAKFDPSGQFIVSANGNGTIYVWRP